jgi:hypothetical protein
MHKRIADNQEVYSALSTLVAQEVFGMNINFDHLSLGPLKVNDFSSGFSIDLVSNSQQRGVYIKIPKADFSRDHIFPITSDDRRLAEEEYRSLVTLSEFWDSGDIKVNFVKPLKFINNYNAIITERVYAQHLFKFFRKCDLLRKIGLAKNDDPMYDIFCRIGKALAKYHQKSFKKKVFIIDETISKFNNYCLLLSQFGVEQHILKSIIAKLAETKGYNSASHITKTIKGLDIRNILFDNNYNIYMLDPGKTKQDYKEMDLARFIVTCRILYWGSFLFFHQLSPHDSYENMFLKGYYYNDDHPGKLLIIFLIKELLKHWLMAYKVLQIKKWPMPMKRFLKFTYIDPFYKNQLSRELNKL